jgi:TPR repeat protein
MLGLTGQPVEFNPDTVGGWEMSTIERQREDAEHGSSEAQFQLGIAYFEGETIEQNYGRSVWWIRKAAKAGHPFAQGFLGAMYADGIGVPQEDSEAYVWHAIAAANGEGHAAKSLERLARRLTPITFLAAQSRAQRLNAKIQEGIRTGKPFGTSGIFRPRPQLPSKALHTPDRNLA